jgi:hypothetical protein
MNRTKVFIVVFVFTLVWVNLSFAQLSKDIKYMRGTIVSLDENKKILIIRDGTSGPTQTFDISAARRSADLRRGQEVFVITPLNSNKAKSIRILTKK